MSSHYQILIIGAGNAGISIAAQLHRKNSKLKIAIIDPADKHYYQPAFTLVGGGVYDIQKTIRNQKDVIPSFVRWIKEYASEFIPEENTVKTKDGNSYTYDYLVVCPGIQINWDWIEGLPETINKNGVCSNYSAETAPYTYELLKKTTKGNILFTNPGTPVKCGGASQKVMYLSADNFKKRGLSDQVNLEFCSAGRVIFGIKKYEIELKKLIKGYGIKVNFKHDLIKIDGPNHKATFKITADDGSTSEVIKDFDMIHVTPPQSTPNFIKNSPLSNADGWIDVDKHTLQHTKYPNIFAAGDATNTPNAKTGAAIRKQAPILVYNLLEVMNNSKSFSSYNGYTSCPIVVGYGKLILAEFDYNNEPMETFPFDQAKPSWLMYKLKTVILPWLYWNKILKGIA